MPGLLKPGAECPKCGTELLAISDLTEPRTKRVTREYFHEKGSPKARRKPRCLRIFDDIAEAERERRDLEV